MLDPTPEPASEADETWWWDRPPHERPSHEQSAASYYATVEQLAEALDVRVTRENRKFLEACLAAAAEEIDHFLEDAYDWVQEACWGDEPDPPELVILVNINRAVEWYRAPASYSGYHEIGAQTPPPSGFERHWVTLLPLRERWGLA